MPRVIRFILLVTLAVAATVAASSIAYASGTSYTWLGQRDGVPGSDTHDWTNPLNWSPEGVPADGDSVVAVPPAGATGLHIDTIPSNLSLVDLTLADTGDSVANTLARVSLQDGSITVTGHLSWTGGQMLTPFTLAAGATGTITGGHDDFAFVSNTVNVYGALTLSGATDTNAVSIDNPSSLVIEPGGNLTSQGDNTVTAGCCINPSHLVNHGTIRADNGTLRVSGVQFDQDDAIAFNHGSLITDSAPFNAADGGRYTGSGTWAIQDNSGERVTLSGTQTLAPNVTLALRPSTADAEVSLGGTFTLAGSGSFLWAGGTVEGTATIGHGITVRLSGGPRTGNSARTLQGKDYTGTGGPTQSTFTNHGRFVLAARAQLNTSGGARLINATDGTIAAAAGTAIVAESCCVHPDSITNAGSFLITAESQNRPVALSSERVHQTGGTLSIARNAALSVDLGSLEIAGGQLVGGGAVDGAVTNTGGRISPGGSEIGSLAITGSYTQPSKGALLIDEATTQRHDVMSVGGRASITGRISVTNHGSNPSAGATRKVLTAKTLRLSPACTTTTGAGSTGQNGRHWVATDVAARYLQLVSKPGARTHC
jgi:hypothetical protein